MNDFHTTVSAAPVGLPLAAAAAAITFHRMRHRGARVLVPSLAAVAYVAAVVTVTLFPLEITFGRYASQTDWWSTLNWIPVLTIDPTTFVANIVLMVPLGILLPLLGRAASVRDAVLGGLVVSLGIEATQLLLRALVHNGRSVDVNDVLANTSGAAIGFLLLRAVRPALAGGERTSIAA